ncbi:MAG TPA: NAD(P)/FAD-dependent oxidoreductase [Solirubrobacteraceae bacterium]|nr:NAD(P)/FAD-dependent oxidoreductase [Solirubrobacteraceae bacterium]
MTDAIVVGSGPNGLACAAALAGAGVRVTVLEAHEQIGGGTRTSELTLPGLLHDHCSAVHPMGYGSPYLRTLGLEQHGLRWCWAPVDLAHPLDDGSAGVMVRSIEATAAGLGRDGRMWKGLFGASARAFDDISEDTMGPLWRPPRHPLRLARFGIPAAMPATVLARAFRTEQARALFGGVAAHSFSPLSWPMTSAIGVAMVCAGHAYGWPVPEGGSQAIANALARLITEHGGTIQTGVRVGSLSELPRADAVVLDLAPRGVLEIAEGRLPARVERAYRRYRYGPGAYKVDLAVQGGVPWRNEDCRRAGTVHVAGPLAELARTERENNRGRLPARPMTLVGQQYLADPTRSRDDVHPVWAYAHVPNGYAGDATDLVIDGIERFAPGLRERILATSVRRTNEWEAYNANFVGGDIITGANTPWQFIVRPRLALDPYATGIPGVFICSAATPPGGGVHGMGGYHAAQSALRHLGAG